LAAQTELKAPEKPVDCGDQWSPFHFTMTPSLPTAQMSAGPAAEMALRKEAPATWAVTSLHQPLASQVTQSFPVSGSQA
jgi:hypothetical protein